MGNILGLDLGSSSIGWAVISETDGEIEVKSLGSRIIPLSTDDATEFSQGNAISKNASRTQRRTQRKGYDRYQQRRKSLTIFLREQNMLLTEMPQQLEKLQLWGLRAKAVNEQLTLPEIGRVLYHINQKRGYKSTREDSNDKAQREYVEKVMSRHREIAERGITIGQLFFEELSKERSYRTKDRVFPRKAYIDEFDRIIACQKKFYPQVFTDENIDVLRNRIIFYQRGLKSCKHLVSICDFEKRAYTHGDKIVFDGPKVAPKSSPLAQICKIRESINNITLKNRKGEELEITPAQRQAMFHHLDNKEKLTLDDLYRILGIDKTDGWWGGKAIGKGIQGNTTKLSIRKALGREYEELLRFNLSVTNTNLVDPETGEIIRIIADSYQDEPLYRLWHLIYSIKDKGELSNVLQKRWGITDPVILENLFALDFVKQGYTNKSAKAMRRILPYLELGLKYSEACEAAGFRHSESLTTEENQRRELKSRLEPILKNQLRQPIVEKILNQMINVVNALLEEYGEFTEIRVELARELKQSKDERNETTKAISKSEKENKTIAERIFNEYNLTPTRSRIQKYKMWEEAEQICFYCGQSVGVAEFLRGFDVEIEHIIPRSLFFDDSFSNKVCSCRKCNKEKNNQTAYDYMKSKPDSEFNSYLERIERLYRERKISKTKYERLLTAGDKIPTDFIDRQLRESQYIARKSCEILRSVCRQVTTTSGSVTSFIRHTWGWDQVLHSLNFDRYKQAGLTQIKTSEHKGTTWSEEIITDWSKRLDHRHHAIDALVIACTQQGYIQRMNDFGLIDEVDNTYKAKQAEEKSQELEAEYKQEKESVKRERLTKLEKYIRAQPHLSTAEVEKAVASILVSFKTGKKVAVMGKRYIQRGGKRVLVQDKIVVPRGALHEESLYGQIGRYTKNRKGETSLQKQCVLKYRLESITRKDIDFIVDGQIKKLVKERFENQSGSEKEIWKDLENNPLLFNGVPVKTVRCFTGLNLETMAILDRGVVKLGNNHHIAIYTDSQGKRHESCVTFWQAVERKKAGIPIVIAHPNEVWDHLPDGLSEAFLNRLPLPDWNLEVSLQQNEMFILGLEPEAFEEALRSNDYAFLSKYLYRVQKISTGDYWFRLHIETQIDKTAQGKEAKKYYRLSSKGFNELNPIKVKISLLGKITKI